MQERLSELHGQFYTLHAWVVMPNHGHALLAPLPGISLAECMKRIKGGSAHTINALLGRKGRLWQPESHDQWIRSEEHF